MIFKVYEYFIVMSYISRKRLPREARIIGANLQYLREASGLSQIEIGQLLSVSSQQVQKYERGQNRLPIDKLYRLKQFYDVPYEIFFQGFRADSRPLPHSARREFAVSKALLTMKNTALLRKIEKIIAILTEE